MVDGRLHPSVIDKAYCFSFVHKGNFKLHLLPFPGKEAGRLAEEADGTFVGLTKGQTYAVEVEEDPEEAAAHAARPVKILDAAELTRLRLAAEHAGSEMDARKAARAEAAEAAAARVAAEEGGKAAETKAAQ